ncbi:MAG: helix-turn-helix domain-containing protein [Bacillota bacterium]|jgi:hypothetical protein
MQVNYNKLWKRLIDLNLKKYQLREQAHISSNSMAKLGKNEYVSLIVRQSTSGQHLPKQASSVIKLVYG